MLMTKYSYEVEVREDGVYITVVRLADEAEKVFFLAGHKTDQYVRRFMDSITDDLAASYFPKPRDR